GNFGAVATSAILILGRIPGVKRPAIATVLPNRNPKRPLMILDAGANMDCHPEWLVQFAIMGNAYSKAVLGRGVPAVGLVSIGTEDCKGNEMTKATFPLLKVSAKLLNVEEFAKRYQVLPVTVRQWIRRGKLRTATKVGTEWRIPELTELPVRGYRSARYEWSEKLTSLPDTFSYINNYNSAEFTQDEKDKNLYHVDFSGDNGDRRINCNIKGREQLELMLISDPAAVYVSDSFGLFA
ncbi:MAG: helix-turn-helix domain-containing protein, partial [Lachnospiraceae bacterium]|nr:helix-turn-helix domain-containing protein [Lachnospiraceae bacterium]